MRIPSSDARPDDPSRRFLDSAGPVGPGPKEHRSFKPEGTDGADLPGKRWGAVMPPQPDESVFAVPAGQEHPSWSRYAYLCGECGEVTYADDWLALMYDEGDKLVPADGGEDPILRCPVCKTDHRDTDDDSGMWAGTRKEMCAERDTQLADPIMADSWISFWKDRADATHPGESAIEARLRTERDVEREERRFTEDRLMEAGTFLRSIASAQPQTEQAEWMVQTAKEGLAQARLDVA